MRGTYFTDFMHGSLVESSECDDFAIPVVGSSTSESVSEFEEHLRTHEDYHVEHGTPVVLLVRFVWIPGRVIGHELPKSKQLIVPPRGGLKVLRVVEFRHDGVPGNGG